MDEANGQLPYLFTFSLAAELSSFTGAAKALGLTQAAVSQRIQQLEKQIRKGLFERRGGGVFLTDAGRRLHTYALRIHDLQREARKEISGRDQPVRGELALAASSVPGEYLLPQLLSGFGSKYPNIRVRVAISDSLVVLRQVERGEAAIGLVGRKIEKPHLTFQFLARDQMVLVAPPNHPLARKKRVTVKQLLDCPIIVRESGSGLRHCFEKALERTGRSVDELQVALELGSNEAIKEAVQRGIGIAVLSTYAVHKELAGGRLQVLSVNEIRCDREMYIVQDRRRVLPLPARLFLAYLETNRVPASAP